MSTNSWSFGPIVLKSASARSLSLFLLCSIAAVVILSGLGNASLKGWDESVYAQISKEMVLNGNWLAPHWQFQLWFEKPPLFMWSTAIFFRLFGINEFWARAASALSGITLIGIAAFTASVIYDEWVGFLSGIILLTSSEFLISTRNGTTDIMLTMFSYLAIYSFLRSGKGSERWWYVVWSSFALAFMVKSAAALFVSAAIGLSLLFDRETATTLRSKHFWGGACLAVLLIAPWHIYMHLRYGAEFWSQYVGYHIVKRVVSPISGYYGGGRLFYFSQLQDDFFPWFFMAPFGLALAIRDLVKDAKARSKTLLFVILLVFGLYTAVKTKFPHYMVPIFPAMAILTAAAIVEAWRRTKSAALGGLIVACVGGALIAPVKLVLLGAGLVGVAWLLVRSAMKSWAFYAVPGSLVLYLVAAGASSVAPLYRPEESPEARLARFVVSTMPQDHQPIIVLGRYGHGPGPAFTYYSNRGFEQIDRLDGLAPVLANSDRRLVLTGKPEMDAVAKSFSTQVIAEDDPLILVYFRTLPPRRETP